MTAKLNIKVILCVSLVNLLVYSLISILSFLFSPFRSNTPFSDVKYDFESLKRFGAFETANIAHWI